MASNFHKVKNGLNVEPKAGSTVTTQGDVSYNSTSNQVEVFGAAAAESLTTNTNAQTLTNKTLTAPVISTISNTGTLTLPTSTDTLVGRATTDTLTNKTLTAPVISTISNTGTLTLPTSTDTLVGRATTDTLTNKSISGSTNTITNVSLTTGITGTLPIANGGTNATTKTAAFDSLSPMTTAGDLIYGGTAGTGTRLPGGAANQVLKYVGGVPTWSTFSNNGINYISGNPDAESGTTGWATYLDLASASPVDGTGGTSTLTFARHTTTPLRGTGSFLITQPNLTNVQGNGVSYDFTIDSADRAKPLVVSFDYNASDSFTASTGQTSSASDIEVFIYDVTNAILIPLSPKVLVAKGANNFEFQGEFQTASNSSSYRLILHCATTNAPATGFQLKFDNVFVGPQAITHGAAITDWVAYTPTFTGFGTVANVNVRYRRVGDSVLLKGYFTTGVTTAVPGIMSLPPGLVSDSTTNNPELAGKVVTGNDLTTDVEYQWLSQPSISHVTLSRRHGGSVNDPLSTTATAVSIIGTGQNVTFTEILIKVAGWSSTVEMSQDSSTRIVAAKYIGTGGANIALVGFADGFRFDSKEYDTHAAVLTGAAWRFTAPVSGIYQFSGNMFQVTTSTDVYLYVNGVSVNQIVGNFTAGLANNQFEFTRYLKAGDFAQIIPSTSCTQSDNALYNHINVSRISGPAAIAASETVAASYTVTAFAVTNNTEAAIPLTTKVIDTHSAVASNVFTCPISGYYRAIIKGGPANSVSGGYVFLKIRKNGVDFDLTHAAQFSSLNAAPYTYTTGSWFISCKAGDTLDARIQYGAAGNETITASVSFERT